MNPKGHRGIDLTESAALYDRAIAVIAGGVTSARRRTAVRAQLDRSLNFGAGHRLEVEAAELLVSIVPNAK
jgi:glutamate-1-semialdehyde aminotransferase